MNYRILLLLTTISLMIISNSTLASESDEHTHEAESENESKHESGHGHNVEGATIITDAMALQTGIITSVTGPQKLHQTVTSYGRLTTAPEQSSHVRARFPGIIKSVNVTIGDKVNTGDLLAIVESNESLKQYKVIAPIAGTIIQRHANAGEMTQNQMLFSIADFQTLWAELRVFPKQQSVISTGQSVKIQNQSGYKISSIKTTVAHILPAQEDATYIIARAKINNIDNTLSPGRMVEAKVVISEFLTPVAIKNSALQTMGSEPGVFIKNGETYQFEPVKIGRSDEVFSEVLSGIGSGIEYVTENSYLIKADIEKSEAEHEH